MSFRIVFFKYFRIVERKYSPIMKFALQTLDDKKGRYYRLFLSYLLKKSIQLERILSKQKKRF